MGVTNTNKLTCNSCGCLACTKSDDDLPKGELGIPCGDDESSDAEEEKPLLGSKRAVSC